MNETTFAIYAVGMLCAAFGGVVVAASSGIKIKTTMTAITCAAVSIFSLAFLIKLTVATW